ncbi:hypothetical protein GGR56DRAFT_665300 [Xylariaceae sp. FL0804]|nr:hypothetical protein GGR56DRAFT_665300 [Xylariaceae sp. FL0804]
MATGDLVQQHARHSSDITATKALLATSLLDLLSNTLVLRQTVPYLPISALLKLAATSRSFRDLLDHTPGVFRHINLTRVKAAQLDHVGAVDHGGQILHHEQLDEDLTEDEFYSGPLRGIFHSLRTRGILHNVHTLVLDGLAVTAEFCHDILVDPELHVRILSIREVQRLNEYKLMQALRYTCRPTRSEGMPRLKGLYVFGKKDAVPPPAVATSMRHGVNISTDWNHKSQHALTQSIRCEGDDWYHRRGWMYSEPILDAWAETLHDCRGVLLFDAVLCQGPRHRDSPAFGCVPLPPDVSASESRVATYSLGGCVSCGSAPEGFTTYHASPSEHLPLLSPVPLHSSSVASATRPGPAEGEDGDRPSFVPRCSDCLYDRYCFSCGQWWCESCYQLPSKHGWSAQTLQSADEMKPLTDQQRAARGPPRKIARSCWECKTNCLDCIANTQKLCKACGGGYCILHYDGSTATLCDWCSRRRGRRFRELY